MEASVRSTEPKHHVDNVKGLQSARLNATCRYSCRLVLTVTPADAQELQTGNTRGPEQIMQSGANEGSSFAADLPTCTSLHLGSDCLQCGTCDRVVAIHFNVRPASGQSLPYTVIHRPVCPSTIVYPVYSYVTRRSLSQAHLFPVQTASFELELEAEISSPYISDI